MNIQSHLDNLIRKHKSLDKEIKRIETTAFTSEARLYELKKRKLQVKDEIADFSKRSGSR
ncbi:MAG: YdcH family protein [Candidatus Paracaedibacteraceae bacterium]|nr:YdcH family protein [Candidatus Paracaedibacteraceae bacterium]